MLLQNTGFSKQEQNHFHKTQKKALPNQWQGSNPNVYEKIILQLAC
jgi:uncharacterized membrane protein